MGISTLLVLLGFIVALIYLVVDLAGHAIRVALLAAGVVLISLGLLVGDVAPLFHG